VGSLNVGTLKGREVLVLEVMNRRQLDICCLQETRFIGEGTEMYHGKGGEYKLYLNGDANENAGVGVMVFQCLD
jgi:exonuclease III